jgi:hypothetical protein
VALRFVEASVSHTKVNGAGIPKGVLLVAESAQHFPRVPEGDLTVAVARCRELGEIALDAGRELVALVVRRLEKRELRFPP